MTSALSKFFAPVVAVVARWLAPKAAAGVADILERLLPHAQEVVESLEGAPADNETKRKAAVDALKSAAKQAGIVAASWLLNLAVQTAVARLRAADK